jgi:hypothetical protein
MDPFKNLTRHDIEKVLTAEQLRITQIILFAMLMGSILLLVPINILNATKPAPLMPGGISDFGQMFMYVVFIYAVLAYAFIYFSTLLLLSPKALAKRIRAAGVFQDTEQAAFFLVTMDRQFRIIKNAIFEGVSLLAIVGIFLELSSSEQQLPSDIWLLAIPVVIHTIYLILNFPSKEKIINDIENNILSRLRA